MSFLWENTTPTTKDTCQKNRTKQNPDLNLIKPLDLNTGKYRKQSAMLNYIIALQSSKPRLRTVYRRHDNFFNDKSQGKRER